MTREYYADQHPRTPPLSQSAMFVVVSVLLPAVFMYWLVWTRAYHYTDLQTTEFLVYGLLAIAVPGHQHSGARRSGNGRGGKTSCDIHLL